MRQKHNHVSNLFRSQYHGTGVRGTCLTQQSKLVPKEQSNCIWDDARLGQSTAEVFKRIQK